MMDSLNASFLPSIGNAFDKDQAISPSINEEDLQQFELPCFALILRR